MNLFENFGVLRSKFEGANAQTPRKCTKATNHGSSTDQARVTGRAGRFWDFPTVTPLVFAATVSKNIKIHLKNNNINKSLANTPQMAPNEKVFFHENVGLT